MLELSVIIRCFSWNFSECCVFVPISAIIAQQQPCNMMKLHDDQDNSRPLCQCIYGNFLISYIL